MNGEAKRTYDECVGKIHIENLKEQCKKTCEGNEKEFELVHGRISEVREDCKIEREKIIERIEKDEDDMNGELVKIRKSIQDATNAVVKTANKGLIFLVGALGTAVISLVVYIFIEATKKP